MKPRSQAAVIALALAGIWLAFDLSDAEMNDGTFLLVLAGWSFVAWQTLLRRIVVPAAANNGRPIYGWQVLAAVAGVGLLIARANHWGPWSPEPTPVRPSLYSRMKDWSPP